MSQSKLQIPRDTSPVAILVRHAERYPIKEMRHALIAPLTDRGRNDAASFGLQLSHIGRIDIYHSPVPRCKETAEWIRNGLINGRAEATIVGHLEGLGGPYAVGPWEDLASMVDRMGHSRFVRAWFNGDIPDTLIMPLPQAARHQLNILIDQLRHGDRSTINVTHDWNIMAMREYYFNLKHEDIGDPGYLDGLWATLKDDAVRLSCCGFERLLPLTA